jgi:gliding motility-associated-like protein
MIKKLCISFCLLHFIQSVSYCQVCCCGTQVELNFPGFDFEIPPDPPYADFIPYPSGSSLGQWNVTTGYIDHIEGHHGNIGAGNPNGISNFVDLVGSPPPSYKVPGAIQYILTGLTPGNLYTLEFYYAKGTIPGGTHIALVKVANGAWLNASVTANNPGDIIWLKASFNFTAQASSASLDFIDASSTPCWCGVELDDIKIFECPSDIEGPTINNPPADIEVECDAQIPGVPQLSINDNCDPNPMIVFHETTEIKTTCTKKITRTWTVTDACGNVTTEDQVINISDPNPPQFTRIPINISINCDRDVDKEFNDWIKKNGNAIAVDECGAINWRTIFDHRPEGDCEIIPVEFIAIDHCGNERSAFANFVVQDTSAPKFIVKAEDKHFTNIPNIRDSLREWLQTNGFSKTFTDCGMVTMSSNFKGDSSKNPLLVTFFGEDDCGNIDSSSATFSYEIFKQSCCCDSSLELNFSGLDFEFGPDPPPAWFINYPVGTMGPWNVTSGSVDHVEKDHYFCSSCGNPNGASNFIDLFGSPAGPGYGVGTMQYVLTGLTPGGQYTLEFYYAKFDKPGNFTANVKIGSWLNANWTATNPGQIVWLKASYPFTATSSSGNLEFTDTGNNTVNGSQIGVLIDDIKILYCPVDMEAPIVSNPTDDLDVFCDEDIPQKPTLDVTDNCDLNPKVSFKETTEIIDPCNKKITRVWTITDACGNITTEDQIIRVSDPNPPQFLRIPQDVFINCDKNVQKEFSDWINRNGNAIATDECMDVIWRVNYNGAPDNFCDTVVAEFITTDHCGNELNAFATFHVIDTTAPKFTDKAQTINYGCISGSRDSLRNWLISSGYSNTTADCGIITRYSDFNGDSTKNPLSVTFYAEDECGNIDSTKASFSYRNSSDTFRITNYSCSYPQNSIDTSKFTNNGCDSIVILTKIKRLADSTYFQLNTCDPHLVFDTLRLVNVNGCDSIIFNEYIFHQIGITTIQKKDCDYVSYSKDTVILPGTYCDSLVITEYFPLQKSFTNIFQTSCDSTESDTITITLVNSSGCDSIITTFINYSPQKITFIEEKICGLMNTYSDTLTFSSGFCDSLLITLHTSLPLDTTHVQSSTCDKSKAGIFSSIKTNQSGCDSLIIQEVILNPSDSISISNSTCILSQAGISIRQFINKFGCDSIVRTITNFIPSDTIRITNKTCKLSDSGSDTLFFNGTICDSIVFTTNVFIPSDTTNIIRTTCDPASSGLSTTLLQNTNGCDSLIMIQTNYVPLLLKFEIDSISCFNKDDGVFRILNSKDFGSPFEVILNNKLFGSQNQISNLEPGYYEIYIRDKNGCITDSIQFDLENPEELIIDLGNNHEVKKGTSITLNLQSNKTLQNIFWNPSNLSNCNTCNQLSLIADDDIWVYTLAIDQRGCNTLDSVFIRVKKEFTFYVPNTFSPNGDNINDYFYIQGDETAIVETLFIYDRWGEKVFETNEVPVNAPAAGWDGTFQSQKMNPGVFVFYAKVRTNDKEEIEITGDLTLVH